MILILKKMDTKRALFLRIRNLQFEFLGQIMRTGDLENLTLTGYTETESGKGR